MKRVGGAKALAARPIVLCLRSGDWLTAVDLVQLRIAPDHSAVLLQNTADAFF